MMSIAILFIYGCIINSIICVPEPQANLQLLKQPRCSPDEQLIPCTKGQVERCGPGGVELVDAGPCDFQCACIQGLIRSAEDGTCVEKSKCVATSPPSQYYYYYN